MNKNTKIKEQFKKTISYVVLVLVATVFTASISPASAYNCDPGDTACEEAKANMEAKRSEADLFSQKASSVSEIIKQLDEDIANLEDSIAKNEKKIKKLNIEIEETEEKLEETKEALAEILVNMHFNDDSEPIRILAGSRSISDYAEKAAREEVAKQEIATMSEKVKKMKEDLDNQKAEVEEALRINESEKLAAGAKKESQKALKATYEKNADDAAAIASYWESEVRRMTWKPAASGTGIRSDDARNTYPYGGNCGPGYVYEGDNIQYPYGGLICQCTDYVSWKAYEKFGIWNNWGGDAWQYIYAGGRAVPSNGHTTYVDSTPAPNTIAIWPMTCDAFGCNYGHVQWVESVNPDGTINVTEYNVDWPAGGCYAKDFCARDYHPSAGASFLHFE